MLGATRQKAVEIDLVDAVGGKHRFRDALGRILVEIDVGGAERQVHVGNHHLGLEQGRHGPGDVVADGRGTDATLGADEGDGAAERLGIGIDEQRGDDAHQIGDGHRRDHVFGNAVPDEFAIQRDIVVVTDDDDLGVGIADFGEIVQIVEEVVRAGRRFQNDQVRRRRGLVELDGRRDAAHIDAGLRLGHAAVLRPSGLIGAATPSVSQKAWIEMRGTGRTSFSAEMSPASAGSSIRSSW